MGKIFDKTLAPSESVYDGKMLDPREIRINAEFNGRHELPAIDDLLSEFPTIGQLFPVLITKDDDGAPVLLDGHRRYRAAIELTRLKKGPHQDANGNSGVFKLKCQYFKGTPSECFIATVKANSSRAESLPIDDGYNVSKLHNTFGMSYEDIAVQVYGRKLTDGSPDVKWVQEREALSDLAAEAAEAVSGGRVKPSAVLELSKLSKTAQRSLLKSTEGKITAAVIKRASAPPASVNGTGTTSDASADAPRAGKPPKTAWDKKAVCAKLQEWIDMDLPLHIARMDAENAIRTVLAQIQEEIQCGTPG
jgi:hypothetical protein